MQHQTDKLISDLLIEGVEQDVFPGGATAVSWHNGSEWVRSCAVAGVMDISHPDQRVTKNTFFDLASLSKPLSTTLILYSLIDEKQISLDDTLGMFFKSELPADKQSITIRQLLSHSSGIISYSPYFREFIPKITAKNREKLLNQIFTEPLQYTPGKKCVYSDFDFILLGWIIERITAKDLVTNLKERITAPLGLENDIFYNPVTQREAQEGVKQGLFASTEDCPWRGRVMRAEVDDEHCWLVNGVAGHAGLFGRIEGVQRLTESILDHWQGRGSKWSWSKMLQQGLQKQYTDQTWCLGFDSPSAQGSSGGRYLSPQSVGHLGFTGTSFWIDPEKELVVTLLTNRVHPTRENIKIRKFRPCFHDRVIEKIINL